MTDLEMQHFTLTLSLAAGFLLLQTAKSEDTPFHYADAGDEITRLMLQKSSDIAHVRILELPRTDQSDLDSIVGSEMLHPRYWCEVIDPIKGALKAKDRFIFLRSKDVEIPKDLRIFKAGQEFIVFLTRKSVAEGSNTTALTLLDNWCGVIPYDASLKDILLWHLKNNE